MTKTTPVELEPLKPENERERETPISAFDAAAIRNEMQRIRSLFVECDGDDREDLISYARHVVEMRTALTRTLPQSLMIPNAISAIKRQVDDRERDKLEGHLAGTYISLSPEQAKEIVQFFEYRGAHEGTAAMRRALRSARGWLNVIAQDRPDGSDIHRVLDDVDAALAAIAHTQ